MRVDIKADKMRELFISFDEDRSGAIDADEFIMKLYPPSMRKDFTAAGETEKKSLKEKMAENDQQAKGNSVQKSSGNNVQVSPEQPAADSSPLSVQSAT